MCEVCLKRLLNLFKKVRAQTQLSIFCRSNLTSLYIYGGMIPLEEENKASWLERNFSLAYQTSFKHDSFSELQKFCADLITDEPEKVFKSL